ncbi:MAG: TonB-dependent siderophore receptor [Gemmatimonadaceae bacterium]|nr:TonB-dependent siderophore receptor [Gemmatimonadaceae bacterium]
MHFIKLALVGAVLVPSALQSQTKDSVTKDSAVHAHELETVSVREKLADKSGYNARRISSATKTNVPLLNVPQSITVLTNAALADQSVQSMAEIARFIPGVTFGQGEGHRDAPTIRGNASTADFFLDGVRDDAQYHRDIYNVERVEALKGSNAMAFGRGGGGGVINRVTRIAEWSVNRSVVVEGGSADHKRTTLDFGNGITTRFAARVTGMAENSGSFRQFTTLSRRGINPTATFLFGKTMVHAGYERFVDARTVDRGVPSFQGRPSSAPIYRFFGDPGVSNASLSAHNGNITVEREWGSAISARNRTQLSSYDKSYANVFPGAASSNGSQVTLTGYRNSHDRSSFFNQTDLVFNGQTGAVKHALLAGSEFGNQKTLNFRETGFFGTATSLLVAFASPSVVSNVAFRQNATDADNDVRANVAAIYAQDQLSIGKHWQAIVGARQEAFEIRFRNRRNSDRLERSDRMTSPRAGLVFKPVDAMSFYGSVAVSHLPGSGDQFSSLTATTETLKPERFTNHELGFKWDLLPALSVSSAVYSLDRNNTSAPDPVNPTRVIQTGSQRSTGFEANFAGNITPKWNVIAGIANQSAEITERTSASRAGASVPLVPGKSASLWTRYDVDARFGVGVGMVAQSKMYAAIDNTVTLPGFERTDAAIYFVPARNLRAQVNIENAFNVRYFATSHGNNNILPGAPRTVRLSLRVF